MPVTNHSNLNNSIYLRRKCKLFVERGEGEVKRTTISSLLINIESLGFTFSKELTSVIATLSQQQLIAFYDQLIIDLKEMVGASVEYKPMYPNFPWQVMQATDAELYFNAFMHYLGDWIGARILPGYKKEQRDNLGDRIKLKVIAFGTPDEFESIFTTLLRAKVAVTPVDKLDLEWFVQANKDNIIQLLPADIPSKENLSVVCAYIISYTDISNEIVGQYIKTATDVLRLAVALSGGDVSLAENSKFKSFSKKQRKSLLALLEGCKTITEDMLRFKNRWIRLGEKLHPFEYKTKYPKCFEAFDIIRNNKPFTTFNSKIESSLLSRETDLTIVLLKSRPGEYARRLDNILRSTDNSKSVLETFRDIAFNVSNPVLLQLLAHFKSRNNPPELRTFFPKGNVFQAKAIKYNLPELDKEVCSEVISICETALIEKYKTQPELGNCYIDEELKNFTVPFALRSASKALKTISRGSKIDLPDGNTVRFFIWWKDGKHRTDLDLSAIGLDENHKYVTDIAYYNLKSLGGCHSGDITSAPEGASEFIDVDIASFLREGIRFLIMSVNSFTSQPFYELPECFAGFMMRQEPNSGEVYEPKTVVNKFDLTSNSKISIPLMIDLLERKIYWTDISLKANPYFSNNVYNNMSSITIIAKSMMSLVKPNLYDLFDLNVQARGKRVTNIKEAKHIFAIDKGITPFHIEEIIADYI
jgi:stress response protein SCP2